MRLDMHPKFGIQRRCPLVHLPAIQGKLLPIEIE
jgi:hypothetical protein